MGTDQKHRIKFTACNSASREAYGCTQTHQNLACLRGAVAARAQQYQVGGKIPSQQSWNRSKSNQSRSPTVSTEKSLCKSLPFILDFQHPFLFTATFSHRLKCCHPLPCLGPGLASPGHYRRGIKNHTAKRHKISHLHCKLYLAADTSPLQQHPIPQSLLCRILIAEKPLVTWRERGEISANKN